MTVEGATSCVFCRILQGELTRGVVAFRDSQTAVFPAAVSSRVTGATCS